MNNTLIQLKGLIQKAKIAAGILNRKIYTGPWHVQVDLTYRCNNNCLACWCNSPLLGDREMDSKTKAKTLPFERVIHLVDELDAMGVREIHFTGGGEPFMHPRILDIMKHVKNKRIEVGMNTNFTLVDKKIARQLVDIGIDRMIISLWAATPAIYEKLHPNKSGATFKAMGAILDYINQLKKQKNTAYPKLEMYNVISIYNYHELHQMLEFAFLHKMNGITFTPVDTIPGKTESLEVCGEAKRNLVESINKLPETEVCLEDKYPHHKININSKIFQQRIHESDNANYDCSFLESMASCYAGWNFARILADGEVNFCLKSFKMPVGNIYEKSFEEIWTGTKQNQFRRHTINYDCRDPFLKDIGNYRFADNQGCYKCCDNLEMNISIHKEIMALGPNRKKMLQVLGHLKSKSKNIHISAKGSMT